MNVSLVYSDAERNLAQRIKSALEEIGTNVITADPEQRSNWGKSRLDLTEGLYADSVNNCILLLSRESIPMVRRHHEHLSALVRVINTRPGFVLPLACEQALPAVPDIIGTLIAKPASEGTIISLILEHFRQADSVQRALKGYDDLSVLLKGFDPRSTQENVAEVHDRTSGVGYRIVRLPHRLNPDLGTLFIEFYQGVAIGRTVEHLTVHYPWILRNKSAIALLSKEKNVSKPEMRKQNFSDKLGIRAFYIDEFIWEFCNYATHLGVASLEARHDFVNPYIENSKLKALDYIREWSSTPGSPLLVVMAGGGVGKTTVVAEFSSEVCHSEIRRATVFIDTEDAKHLDYSVAERTVSIYSLYIAHARRWGIEAIDEDLFRINLDNGNLVVIIDGLDEMIARNPSRFDIPFFVDTIHKADAHVGKCKVVITCRDSFWNTETRDEVFVSIELKPFDTSQTEAYFAAQFGSNPGLIRRAMVIARSLNRSEEMTFAPFALSIVVDLINREQGGESEVDDISFGPYSSELLCADLHTDYILYRFCKRELLKFGLSIDEQVLLFNLLALQSDHMVTRAQFYDLFREIVGETVDASTVETFMGHALLRKSDETVSFRYDFFDEHFVNVHLGRLLTNSEVVLTKEVAIALVRVCRFGSSFTRNAAIRLRGNGTWRLNALARIAEISELQKDKHLDDRVAQRAVGSIVNIGLQDVHDNLHANIESYTDLLRDFFGTQGNSLSGVCIYGINRGVAGNRITFDFTQKHIAYSHFEDYSDFWDCKFDSRTRFTSSVFRQLMKGDDVTTSALYELFEHKSCVFDENCRLILEGSTKKLSNELDRVESDVRELLGRFVLSGGRTRWWYKESIKGSFAGRPTIIPLVLDAVLEFGVLFVDKKDLDRIKVVSAHRAAIESFIYNGAPHPLIKDILERLAPKRVR